MGTADEENRYNGVSHTATLKKNFYLGEIPVTQEQWEAVMGKRANKSEMKGARLPVIDVSWHDAMNFCAKLNKKLQDKLPPGYHFILPTETQWEYAARGGKKSKEYKYSGSDNLAEVGWYNENSGDTSLDESEWSVDQLTQNNCKPHPVGMKKANELGLYDMSGNVWEWCLDDYVVDSSDVKAEFTRGKDSSSAHRVMRGGSWYSFARNCRVAYRINYDASSSGSYLGFRVALAPVQY